MGTEASKDDEEKKSEEVSKDEKKTDDAPKDGEKKAEGEEASKEAETSKEDKEDEEKAEDEAMEEDGTEDEEADGEESADEKKDETTDEKKDEEEEPSNLQLAWEMLELAKVVYTKQLETAEDADKSHLLERLCSTMLALGEVSIEIEITSRLLRISKSVSRKKRLCPRMPESLLKPIINLELLKVSMLNMMKLLKVSRVPLRSSRRESPTWRRSRLRRQRKR